MQNPQSGNAKSYIHYDPIRDDYSVSQEELSKLCDSGNNNSKDFFLICVSLGIPCLINALGSIGEPFVITLNMFLNSTIGVGAILLSVFFGIGWGKSYQEKNELIKQIKDKPRMPIEFSSSSENSLTIIPDENTDNI